MVLFLFKLASDYYQLAAMGHSTWRAEIGNGICLSDGSITPSMVNFIKLFNLSAPMFLPVR